MDKKKTLIYFCFFCMLAFSCMDKAGNTASKNDSEAQPNKMEKSINPVVYFEIPVTDIDRAIKFYHAVFGFQFDKEIIDHNEMALFPFRDESSGISGALAKGEIYKPTKDGVLIYFNTGSIDETLKKAQQNGAEILYPKTSNGELGFVAEFEDSEGNRIALHEPVK